MTAVTGLTAARMAEIEAASVVSGEIVGDDLILTKFDASTVNAGDVRGPQGLQGDPGNDGVGIPAGGTEGQILVKSSGVDYAVEWQTFLRLTAVTLQMSNYTLVMDDAESVVMEYAATDRNVTVPPSTEVDFPIGTTIRVVQAGDGLVTVVAGSGVAITTPPPWTYTTAGLGAIIELIKLGTDAWILNGMGNLATTDLGWVDWTPNLQIVSGTALNLGDAPVKEGRYCMDSLGRVNGYGTVRYGGSGQTQGSGAYKFKLPEFGKNRDALNYSPIGAASIGATNHKTGLLHFLGAPGYESNEWAVMAMDDGLFASPDGIPGSTSNAHYVFQYEYDPTP